MNRIQYNQIAEKEIRKFFLILSIVLALVGGVMYFKGDTGFYKVAWIVAGFLGVTSLFTPVLLRPLYYLWMQFAYGLGWLNTRILLSVLFCLIFAPIGIMFKLIGIDPLDRKLDKTATSYWKKRKSHWEKEKYRRLF